VVQSSATATLNGLLGAARPLVLTTIGALSPALQARLALLPITVVAETVTPPLARVAVRSVDTLVEIHRHAPGVESPPSAAGRFAG
jgi:hypothetical protein